MPSWPVKDPDAVLDYLYRIPLDAGDSVISYELERLSGTVAIVVDGTLAGAPDVDAAGNRGQDVTDIELSGGEDGETSVFRFSWVTAGGREDDDIVTLFVSSHEFAPLVLIGYEKPRPAHLIARYPAFAAVGTGTIQYWLTDAERYVTDAWTEGDYAAGLMALAAHNMTLAGYGAEAASIAGVPAGVSRFKSGMFEMSFTDTVANARAAAGYDATRYGTEYSAMLRRNRSGPLVTPPGAPPPGAGTRLWP